MPYRVLPLMNTIENFVDKNDLKPLISTYNISYDLMSKI